MNYDKDNKLHSDICIKSWTDSENMTWKNYSINIIPEFSGLLPESKYNFNRLEKKVFFRHYWLTGTPELLQPNICCLDYSVANGGQLVEYRKNGEIVLSPDNFIETMAAKKICYH